jgi:hypothetical protein
LQSRLWHIVGEMEPSPLNARVPGVEEKDSVVMFLLADATKRSACTCSSMGSENIPTMGTVSHSSSSQSHHSTIVIPREHDVLLGRGKGPLTHFGNCYFHHLVDKHLPRYRNCSTRMQKAATMNVIVGMILEKGRFLERPRKNSEGWEECSRQTARMKVGQALRYKMSRQDGPGLQAKDISTSNQQPVTSTELPEGIPHHKKRMKTGAGSPAPTASWDDGDSKPEALESGRVDMPPTTTRAAKASWNTSMDSADKNIRTPPPTPHDGDGGESKAWIAKLFNHFADVPESDLLNDFWTAGAFVERMR